MGKPILVLVNSLAENRFASYISEILDTEGFFCKDTFDAGRKDLTGSLLEKYPLVILSNMSLSEKEKELLRSYAANGVRLIALRPDKALADIFGVVPDQFFI